MSENGRNDRTTANGNAIPYRPTNPADWSGEPPQTAGNAIERIVRRIDAIVSTQPTERKKP